MYIIVVGAGTGGYGRGLELQALAEHGDGLGARVPV